MPTHISLYNFTQKGAETMKEAPARIDANVKAVEAAGLEIKGWYLTMGQYDVVVISEAPDDETAANVVVVVVVVIICK